MFADIIREKVSTRAFCESVGINLDRHGNALCPFHGDTNKSLKVYKDPARGWTCFGCHKGGSVIDFAMEYYGITFRQAVVRLDADFGLGLELTRKPTVKERREERRRREEQSKREMAARFLLYAAETSEKNAFMELCEVLTVIERNRPKRAENAVSDAYVEALWKLPIIKDEYDRALDVLNMARKEVGTIGTADATA